MKTQIVYKAVRKSFFKDRFESAVVKRTSPQLTSYAIGVTTSNPKMPLFALKTIEDTKDPDWAICYIFECNAVISPKQPKRRANICYNMKLFWNQIWNKKKVTVPTEPLALGTIFCSSITLTKMIRGPIIKTQI